MMGKLKLKQHKAIAGHGKDPHFIRGMTQAGKLAAKLLTHVCSFAKEGVTTLELDKIAYDYTLSNGGTNACLGYKGYPNSICTSVNEVLCHGVPDSAQLKSGDIVNIDVTVKVGPYHGDTSRTLAIGVVSTDAHRVMNAAYDCQQAGIGSVRPMGRTGDIGYAIENRLRLNWPELDLIKQIGGHGIGKVFHDKPFIPSTGLYGTGELIRPWTCLTVEPIVTSCTEYDAEPITPHAGHSSCGVQVFRAKRGLAAQFEHTLLVTDTGFEILTVE
jgi:methionyl aminopeptidase